MFEPVGPAIVRVGHIPLISGFFVIRPEQFDSAPLLGAGHLQNILEVASIHCENQIELIEVGPLELAGLDVIQIHSVPGRGLSHSAVGGITDVPPAGSSRIDFELTAETLLRYVFSEHALSERASAYVSEANKENLLRH